MLTPGQKMTIRGVTPGGQTIHWAFAGEVLADDGDEVVLAVREGELVAGPEPWAWPAAGAGSGSGSAFPPKRRFRNRDASSKSEYATVSPSRSLTIASASG